MAEGGKGGLSPGGIFNFLVATDTAAGNAKLARSRKKMQLQQNKQSAAEAGLARWSQSLGNQKLMNRAGENLATLTENIGRVQDAQTLNKVQRDLATAEQLGAATAAFAAAGMGGSSVEAFKRTLVTTRAIESELQSRSNKSGNYLAQQQRSQVIPDAVDSLNRDIITARIDFTDYGPSKGPSLLGNLAALGMAAGAAAAGAPDIGNAILKSRTAGLQNRQGQGQQAAATFNSALSDFGDGVKQLKDTFRFSGSSPKLRPVDTSNWGADLTSFMIR